MVERIVETTNTTVQTAFEHKIDKLERDKLVLQEKLHSNPGPRRTFEQMFELAMSFLAIPWKLRESDRLEDKRAVLKLTFAERLAYCRKTGFRTPENHHAIQHVRRKSHAIL
ncbi:hypothetical protein [uncultured Roseovarius sp.]|uniref:hypothetical protein n=1 Tax=uncultured Roseovarius sp. TaxID=293344 RepID=UPI002616446C|nr:hypothetical protein [uncultured Roseovarius sp.]